MRFLARSMYVCAWARLARAHASRRGEKREVGGGRGGGRGLDMDETEVMRVTPGSHGGTGISRKGE